MKTLKTTSHYCLGPFAYGYIIELIGHPSEPDTLFGRSDVGGLFLSRDAGESWEILHRGIAPSLKHQPPDHRYRGDYVYHAHLYDGRYAISSLAIDPFDSTHFLCSTGFVWPYRESGRMEIPGVAFGELYESHTSGGEWTRISDRFVLDAAGGSSRVHGSLIAFHPKNPGEVWMGTSFDGLFVSRDAAKTWEYVGLRGRNLQQIVFCQSKPDTLLCAISTAISYWGAPSQGGLVSVETGSGAITECAAMHGRNVRALALHPSRWFAACNTDGLFASSDSGLTWSSIQGDLDLQRGANDPYYMSWNTIAVNPAAPDELYASAFKIFCTSKDGGATWTARKTEEMSMDVSGTHVHPTEVFSATSCILVDPRRPGRIFATDFYGVWRSDDDGVSWRACHRGMANTCSKRLYALTHPEGKSRVAALMTDGGIKISDIGATRLIRVTGKFNAGALSKPIETPEEIQELSSAASSLAQHPQDPNILYACQNSGQHGSYGMGLLLRSADGGVTWSPCNRGLPRGLAWFRDVVIDPFQPSTLLLTNGFTAAEGGGVYRSEDEGQNWSLAHNAIVGAVDFYSQVRSSIDRSLIADPVFEGRYYTANRIAGVFQSDDRCSTFHDITANLPLLQCQGIASMHYSPALGKLIVGLYGEGLWMRDAAQRWSRLDTGDFVSATAIAEDPQGRIYVAFSAHWYAPSEAGILMSEDRGSTWQQIDTSWLPNHLISCLAADRYEPKLYAGTIGSGCYAATLGN